MRLFKKQWQRFIGRYPGLAARLLGEYPLVEISNRPALLPQVASFNSAIPLSGLSNLGYPVIR